MVKLHSDLLDQQLTAEAPVAEAGIPVLRYKLTASKKAKDSMTKCTLLSPALLDPKHSQMLPQKLRARRSERMRQMWSEEMSKDEPNLDIKFQYALLLIKTRSQDRNREGMALLQDLADCSYHVEECYYSLALALYRMTRYQECREMVELVLRMDPDMPSAQTLHKAVQEAAERRNQNVMGVAAGGAAVAGIGLLVGALLLRR